MATARVHGGRSHLRADGVENEGAACCCCRDLLETFFRIFNSDFFDWFQFFLGSNRELENFMKCQK
jgi:hypothetical protein